MKEFSGMSNEQVRAMTFEIARDHRRVLNL